MNSDDLGDVVNSID